MNVVVVLAHPCSDSFNHALAATAVEALTGAGHHVDLLDLYALGVSAALSADERRAYHGDQPILDPVLATHADLLRTAEALVFVYPTWWSTLPAILKGWLERVMVPGLAFVFDDQHKVRPGLTHVRRIVGISTYGSPRTYVRLINAHAGAPPEHRLAHPHPLAGAVRDRHGDGQPAGGLPAPGA